MIALGPFPWGTQDASDVNHTPFNLSFKDAIRWYWRERFWQIDVNIYDGLGFPLCVGSIIYNWNQTNNKDRFLPPGPPFGIEPSRPEQLGVGWMMDGEPVDFETGTVRLPGLSALYFFSSFLGENATLGQGGASYRTAQDGVNPFFLVHVGGISSSTTKSSNVTGTMDGIDFAFDDSGSPGASGTFDMYPVLQWDY